MIKEKNAIFKEIPENWCLNLALKFLCRYFLI